MEGILNQKTVRALADAFIRFCEVERPCSRKELEGMLNDDWFDTFMQGVREDLYAQVKRRITNR